MLKNNKNVRVMIFLHVCTVAIGISIANPFVALTIKKLLAFGSDLEPYGDFFSFVGVEYHSRFFQQLPHQMAA